MTTGTSSGKNAFQLPKLPRIQKACIIADINGNKEGNKSSLTIITIIISKTEQITPTNSTLKRKLSPAVVTTKAAKKSEYKNLRIWDIKLSVFFSELLRTVILCRDLPIFSMVYFDIGIKFLILSLKRLALAFEFLRSKQVFVFIHSFAVLVVFLRQFHLLVIIHYSKLVLFFNSSRAS